MTPDLHILIIDDKEEITKLFVSMLDSLPKVSSVHVCQSLEEAHRAAQQAHPLINVAILDLFLEDVEGIDTVIRFKQLFPVLPFVVITGYDISGLSYQCFEYGASDFLAKPDISPALLYKSCVYAVEKETISKKADKYRDTLHSLIDVAPIGIGMAVERRIKWVNDYTCEMLGRDKGDLEGQNARVLYDSDGEYERVGAAKYPQIYEGKQGIVETQWVKSDGSLVDIYLGSAAIGPGSPSAGIIFTAMDITKVKDVKRKLQAERDKAQKFLDIAGTMILVIDLDGNVSLINKRGCEILGYESADELIGKNWFDTCILPAERDVVYNVFLSMLENKEAVEDIQHYENHVVRKDGSIRLISWHNSYIRDNSHMVTLSSGEDITEQRATDLKLLEAQRMAQLGHWVWDIKTGDVEWSDEVYSIFRLDPEIFTPKIDSIRELSSQWPEDYQRDKELLQKASESREQGTYEQRFLRPDGTTGYYSSTYQGIFDEAGDLVRMKGTVLDITERKHYEEALRKSEEKYRTAIETAGEGIVIIQDEIAVFLNSRLADIFGYRQEEMLGQSMKRFMHPDSYPNLAERHKRRMAGEDIGKEVSIVKGIHKAGHVIDLDVRVTTLDWEGRPSALAFLIDVTDRVVLEDRQELIIQILKLLNAPFSGTETIESLLKLIQGFTGIEAIALRLQDGQDYPYFVYRGFGHAFISMENFLCSRDEMGKCHLDHTGRPVLDCMCGCVIRGETPKGAPCFTDRGSFWTNSTTELLYNSKDSPLGDRKTRNKCNAEGYESVAIIPLSTGPEIIGSIQLNDTRENMFTESLIEFMEEMALSIAVAVKRAWQEDRIKSLEIAKTKDLLQSSRLLNSGIAHELRTPMQALLNCLELIKEEISTICGVCPAEKDCETKCSILELADDGLDRTEYSVKVLNSLSEYSKIATGEEVHLINVVPELKTIMRTLMFTDQFKSMNHGGFELDIGEGKGECFVSINRIDFSQLITNLCRNAREAIDNEEPEVVISVTEDAPNVTIKVTDNGRGIDSSLGDRVFEPYFSTKENPGGYNQGLGLAMVRDIIAAYGGTITYTSKPGHTEFIVKLPCEHKQ